jgi:pyruvate formate-lyase/glycerol dehydratase family glycyl radical enzyme
MEEMVTAQNMEEIATTQNTEKLTRGQRLWNETRNARDTAPISLHRARLFTAAFKATEGYPQPMRLAIAFERVVKGIAIYFDEGQLLAGDTASSTSAAELHLENSVEWVKRELKAGRPPVGLTDEEVKELSDMVAYWDAKSLRSGLLASFGDDLVERLNKVADPGARVYITFGQMSRSKGWYSPNYEKAIKIGFAGILEEVENELHNTPLLDDASRDKVYLLKGLAIELRAAMAYAARYVTLARELAAGAQGQWKADLEKIANVCEWVPANPARTFHEALQTLWFVHVLGEMDCGLVGWSPGRVDQYLYPYYAADIAAGRTTKEEVIELLECFRVKINNRRAFENVYGHITSAGEGLFHNCTLGGQKADGSDATNELSFLWLEAAFRVRSPHPTLSVRWHEKMNQEFALRAAELSALGMGYPAWFYDDSIIPYLMGPNMRASLEEARDYQLSGCILHTIPHKTGATNPVIISMAKILELAFFDGWDPATGYQCGPHTGRFQDMGTWKELVTAVREQTTYFMREAGDVQNRIRLFRAKVLPQIWATGFFDDCIKRGQDPAGGGCVYQGSSMYLLPVGIMDVVDSLAAVKKIVFEDHSLSANDLLNAMAANFEGYEEERRLLMSAPKYGNDDDYVDSIATDEYRFLVSLCSEVEACYGAKYVCAPHSINLQGECGKLVGALPNGRRAGTALADGGVSPCQGADVHGPTAVINSAGKIDHVPIFGTLFNMKFNPSALRTRNDMLNLLALIKTYFEGYKGKHIQFNVVDRPTLLDAQAHPEHHRNLVVRIAGYSALWVELERVLQDEIIARMEKDW